MDLYPPKKKRQPPTWSETLRKNEKKRPKITHHLTDQKPAVRYRASKEGKKGLRIGKKRRPRKGGPKNLGRKKKPRGKKPIPINTEKGGANYNEPTIRL